MISRHPWNLRNLFRGPQPAAAFAVTDISALPITSTSAVVEWTLNEPATGQVEWGLTGAYGQTTTLAADYLTRHAQTIGAGVNPTPLQPDTTYHCRAVSVNAGGTTAYSADKTFTTLGAIIDPGDPVTDAGPRPAPAQPTGPAVKVIGTATAAVDNTGTTDVTVALQNILNSLNAGDILVFDQTGNAEGFEHSTDDPLNTYRISDTLWLNNVPDNVTLWGYGTKIEQTAYAQEEKTFALQRHDKDGLTISGFELYGPNYDFSRKANIYNGLGASEKCHAIGIYSRHVNTTIEDCWIHHPAGDGIYQANWPSVNWVPIDNFVIRYNRIEDCKRQGIADLLGTNCHVHHNILGNQGGGNYDCEDAKEFLDGIPLPKYSAIIEYNEFQQTTWHKSGVFANSSFHLNHAQGWNDSDGPPNYSQYGPVYIRNNTITGMGPPEIWNPATDTLVWAMWSQLSPKTGYTGETRMQGVYITDNVFDLPVAFQLARLRAVTAGYIDGLVVTGNVLQNLSVSAPTTGAYYCTDVTVSGNT